MSTYWNDNSYIVFNGTVSNRKVFYENDDHTAVTSSNSNNFISKMGCGCLVEHLSSNSPYNSSKLTYYAKPPIMINGPTLVCSGGASFSAANVPPGVTISWNKSSNLNLSSSGIYASVSPNGNGLGWVSINQAESN